LDIIYKKIIGERGLIMNTQIFGDNIVKKFSISKGGRFVFGDGPYKYYYYQTCGEEDFVFNELSSFTIYFNSVPSNASVNVVGLAEIISSGDALQVEGQQIKILFKGGPICFILSGTTLSHPEKKGIVLNSYKNLYRVVKPWGHEVWINGNHPCYALKEIYIKAGTKTSLQFHNFKQETNVLMKGIAKLHYKINPQIANEQIKNSDIACTLLTPVSSVDVLPKTVHRLEAVTDIVLYETSTPYLDDVIRILDDNKRPDGRLDFEHVVK